MQAISSVGIMPTSAHKESLVDTSGVLFAARVQPRFERGTQPPWLEGSSPEDFTRKDALRGFGSGTGSPCEARETADVQAVSLVGTMPTSAHKESLVDTSGVLVAVRVQYRFEPLVRCPWRKGGLPRSLR